MSAQNLNCLVYNPGLLIPGVHVLLPHPSDCQAYYVCQDGVTPDKRGCPKGQVFNKKTSSCDKPANVPDCEDTYKRKIKKPETKGLR